MAESKLNRILGIVGWIGTVLIFGAVAARFIRPEWQPYSRWLAIAGLVCVVAYMASQWREIATSFGRRQTRLGTIAATSVVVVLGILVAVNYLASRRNYRWDLTENKQFSLSDQTKQILQKLDAPVKVLVFDRPTEFDRFRDRLTEYEYLSDRVSVEYIDVDRQPRLAEQNQVQSYGTVVFQYKDRTERVTSSDEQQLTTGLVKLVSGEQRTVYFVQGHGEKDTAASERSGYSAVSSALGSDNYKVEPLVLAQRGDVPDDATVVVIAGPKTDLLPGEIDMLRRYLDRGGKLLVLVDPPERAGQAPLTALTAFLHDYGIEVGNDVVLDVSGVGQLLGTDESVPVVARYPTHAITENFRLMTAYPFSRSVAPVQGGVNGRTANTLLETSPNSWAEKNVDALFTSGRVVPPAEPGGPVSLGAALSMPAPNPPAAAQPETPAAEGEAPADGAAPTPPASDAPKPETRLVVVGDSDFAANYALGIQGNRDLFLNIVSWLAQQENLISIRPKDPQDRRLTLTASQQRLLNWMALLVLPGLVWGTGLYRWTRRRV